MILGLDPNLETDFSHLEIPNLYSDPVQSGITTALIKTYLPSGKCSKERNMLSYLYFPLTYRVVFDCVAEPPVLVAGQHDDVRHLGAVLPQVPHPVPHPGRRRLPRPLAAAQRPPLTLELALKRERKEAKCNLKRPIVLYEVT